MPKAAEEMVKYGKSVMAPVEHLARPLGPLADECGEAMEEAVLTGPPLPPPTHARERSFLWFFQAPPGLLIRFSGSILTDPAGEIAASDGAETQPSGNIPQVRR